VPPFRDGLVAAWDAALPGPADASPSASPSSPFEVVAVLASGVYYPLESFAELGAALAAASRMAATCRDAGEPVTVEVHQVVTGDVWREGSYAP